MANTGIINGRNFVLVLDDGGGELVLGCARETSLDITVDFLEAVCKDTVNGWKEFLPDTKSATLSASGFQKDGNPITPYDLFGHLNSDTKLTWSFGLADALQSTGDKLFTGELYVSQLTVNAGESLVDYSVSFQITGAVSVITVP